MDWLQLVLLIAAGLWGGALNAVAGGGTFFTFPVLIFCGLPPILANSTNKFGMWAGSFASVGGYWSEIKPQKHRLLLLSVIAGIGSVGGSVLLLMTSPEFFKALVPWLMLCATLLFAFGNRIVRAIHARTAHHAAAGKVGRAGGLGGQFAIGVYGGFFGAGIGILLMALYELMGIRNIHQMNGLKVLVATVVNALSVLTFIITGMIVWPVALALGFGFFIGGYYGAVFAKRLPALWIRGFIIVYSLSVTCYFFIFGL